MSKVPIRTAPTPMIRVAFTILRSFAISHLARFSRLRPSTSLLSVLLLGRPQQSAEDDQQQRPPLLHKAKRRNVTEVKDTKSTNQSCRTGKDECCASHYIGEV